MEAPASPQVSWCDPGQLTNAQGRGRSYALRHCPRGTGSRQCGAAGHRYCPSCWMLPGRAPPLCPPPESQPLRKAPGETKRYYLLGPPDKRNPGFLLPFLLNIYSSLRPPSSCPRDTHLWRVCTLSHVALASVEWPLFHIPGNNLLIL